MPVVGPGSPNEKHVKKIYDEVISLLTEKFDIQKYPIATTFPNWQEERDKRNAVLYDAIYSLVELDIWEGW
jgi:hypothetical protein